LEHLPERSGLEGLIKQAPACEIHIPSITVMNAGDVSFMSLYNPRNLHKKNKKTASYMPQQFNE